MWMSIIIDNNIQLIMIIIILQCIIACSLVLPPCKTKGQWCWIAAASDMNETLVAVRGYLYRHLGLCKTTACGCLLFI